MNEMGVLKVHLYFSNLNKGNSFQGHMIQLHTSEVDL